MPNLKVNADWSHRCEQIEWAKATDQNARAMVNRLAHEVLSERAMGIYLRDAIERYHSRFSYCPEKFNFTPWEIAKDETIRVNCY